MQAERRNIAQEDFGAFNCNQGRDASPATTTKAGFVGLGNAAYNLAWGRVGWELKVAFQGLLWEQKEMSLGSLHS